MAAEPVDVLECPAEVIMAGVSNVRVQQEVL